MVFLFTKIKPLYTVLSKERCYKSMFQYLEKWKDNLTANNCSFLPCTVLKSFH